MINTPLIVYGVMLLIGVLGMAAMIVRRVKSSRLRESLVLDPSEDKRVKRENMRTTGPIPGLGLTPSEPLTLSPAEVLVATKHPRQRRCPTCSKSFHESLVICPHDQTPLLMQDEQVQKRRVLDERSLPTCSECSRRYDSPAKYCRVDGKRLVSGSDHALGIWVCRNCGDESAHPLSKCCATPDVEKMDPASGAFIAPIFPVMICPMCHGMTSHSEGLKCSVDGTPLVPVLNLQKTCIAPLGVGPRRRICERCGLKHSKASKFCTHDGSVLKEMN